jgi:hypothetical protein
MIGNIPGLSVFNLELYIFLGNQRYSAGLWGLQKSFKAHGSTSPRRNETSNLLKTTFEEIFGAASGRREETVDQELLSQLLLPKFKGTVQNYENYPWTMDTKINSTKLQ